MNAHQPRLVVPVSARDHVRGRPNAPALLVEYGDFECPLCGARMRQLRPASSQTSRVSAYCEVREAACSAGARDVRR